MFLVFFFLLHLLFDGGQLFGPLSGARGLSFPLLRFVLDRFELLLGNDAEASLHIRIALPVGVQPLIGQRKDDAFVNILRQIHEIFRG